MAHAKISQRKKTKKSHQQEDNQPIDREQAEDLAVTVAGVLNNDACPERLRHAIIDALSELQTRSDCLGNVDFLMGLFLSKPYEAEKTEGGAQ